MIGIYNVESDRVGAFNEDDRQFVEIFGRYVAMALNILDLLVVERIEVAGRLTEGVVQEMSAPLNDIMAEAQTMIEEYIGDDNMRNRLHKIVDGAQNMRRALRDVQAGPNVVLGAEKEEKQVDPILAGKSVLIADDEQNIRVTIADILKHRGCRVETCKDGHEACHLLEQQGFDLVISDIRMPHRNGYDIFATARRRSEHVPVILMTGFGYDPNHSIVRASNEGLNCVLSKPYKVEQLIEEEHSAVEGREGGQSDSKPTNV